MSMTVGDFIIERLHAWGVRKIFGYPGDGINGVFGAMNRAPEKIQFIQSRHEEMAAFMASAYAKFTGELGVCIATSGPGARISSPDFTTRGWTISRSSPSPASRRAPRSAPITSRKSISSACSRMSPAPMSNRPAPPRRSAT